MGAFTHYCDIVLREGGIAHDLHARLVLAAHYRQAAGDDIGISWPDWKARPGEFGFVFRAFGTEAAIGGFVNLIQPLVAAELLRIYPTLAIPAVEKTITFIRDRSFNKCSPSAARRMERRAAARGEVWKGTALPARDHYLMIPTSAGDGPFPLHIARTTRGQESGGRSYGLGRAVPDF